MAVAFDAVGPSAAGHGNTLQTVTSWTHTCVGSGVALLVGVALGDSNIADNTVTVALDPSGANTPFVSLGTRQPSNNGTTGFVQLFGLPNVSSGAHTIEVTSSPDNWASAEMGSISFTGADLTSPFSAQQSGFNSIDDPSYAFTGSTAGNMVAAVYCHGTSITSAGGTGVTQRWLLNINNSTSAGNGLMADVAGGGTVTFTHTTTAADGSGWAAVEILAAAEASTSGGPWFTSPLAEMPYSEKQAPWELRGSQPPIPMQVWVSPPDPPPGDQAISLSDTAVGADALAVAVAVSLSDTGSGADALTTAAAVPFAETAAATDVVTVAAAVPLTDTSAAADLLSVQIVGQVDPYQAGPQIAGMFLSPSAASQQLKGDQSPSGDRLIGLADTASAADVLSVAAAVGLADTGSAAESLTAGVPVALTDTATSVDALTVAASASLADTGSAADALAIAVPIALADTGSSVDSLVAGVPISLTDTGTGADALTVTAAVSLADPRTSSDALTAAAAVSLADTGSSVETLAAGVPIALSDTGTGSDALTVAAVVSLADTATGADALTATAAVPLADTGTAADVLSVNTAGNPSLPDTITATDSLSITVTLPLADTVVSADALARSITVSLTDTGTGTDVLARAISVALSESATATDLAVLAATVPMSDPRPAAVDVLDVLLPVTYGTGAAGNQAVSGGQAGNRPASSGQPGSTLAGSGRAGRG